MASVLTAKLLRVCNSAEIGLREPVTSLDQAVLLLGHNVIFRTVTALGYGGVMSAQVSDLFTWGNTMWSIGPQVSLPIFQGGRNRANLQRSRAAFDEAVAAYRGRVLVAFREVEDGLAAVVRDAEQDEALVREHEAVDRALHLSTQRYREGYANYLDQLDAQRNLLSVELALVQSRLDRFNAATNLFQAVGGGWSPAPPMSASAASP